MSIGRYRKGWILVATAAVVAVLAPSMGQAIEDTQGLILKTEPPGLFLLYTGDVIGYVEPCG